MLIDINSLDNDILSKIPLSIRLNLKTNILDTDTLPNDISYILRNISKSPITQSYLNINAIDITPKLSVYNDFTTLNTKHDTIIEYIKNYLLIDQGSYPFDPSFGTKLKTYINKLDSNIIKLSIDNELRNITYALSLAFNTSIDVLTSRISTIELIDSMIYQLLIELKIDNITANFTINKTIGQYLL